MLKVTKAEFLSSRNSQPHIEINKNETVTHSSYNVITQKSRKGKGLIILAL